MNTDAGTPATVANESTPAGGGHRKARVLAAATRLFCAAAVLLTPLLTAPMANALAAGDSVYVTDQLRVPLRSGGSTEYRIINFLPAGTPMTVVSISSDNNFAEIITQRGTEGWVEAKDLVSQPIARDRLAAAEAEARRVRGQFDKLRADLNAARATGNEASQSNAALQQQVESLQAELAEIRRISAGAIEANDARDKLTALNERLRAEIESLHTEKVRLEDNNQQRWMLIGAALVLGGLLIGLFVKSRPRRSGWN